MNKEIEKITIKSKINSSALPLQEMIIGKESVS